MLARIKETYIYFNKFILRIFGDVAVDSYSHDGFQLTVVGRQ